MIYLSKMSRQREDIDIEELKHDLGSNCCGAPLVNEDIDGIGLCSDCMEWAEYNDITEENIEEWL